MLTKSIFLKSFPKKISEKRFKKLLDLMLYQNNQLFKSMSRNYIDNYDFKKIKKNNGRNNVRVIGIGGSILGAQAIYHFLKKKIKRKFFFINNLKSSKKLSSKEKITNLVISKSGNTLETIANVNLLVKEKNNIFLTENKKSYLSELALKLKAEIIKHNNFIGGRYAVLSEVGMLPAQLMGLDPKKFRQFDNLVKNKKFLDILIQNTNSIFQFSKEKRFNSIILNYDPESEYLFQWYQQLVAESLGKKGKGILPIISTMPKDNHSVMQLYLDGFKNNFFTFFYVNENKSDKINKNLLLSSLNYLKNKDLSKIIFSQKKATENVFKKKNIPFRSFEIKKRDEKTLGELFCFFILETILLGKSLNLNPYDQPAVELIKKETRKLLV